jgi:hypothetical protein
MKLAKVTSNEPTERLAVSIKQSANNLLKQYQDFYKATYGEEIAWNHLVETMLVDYMRDDKDFQAALKKAKSTGAAGSGSAATGGNAGTPAKAE